MDVLSDEQMASHTRKRGRGLERETMRETEYLQIAKQNNAIRTSHIETRIDMTQQNNRCSLCGDRDEKINHIIIECSKLA